MAIYLLNFLSIPIYNVLLKKRRTFVIVLSLQLFFILAFRSETLGVDVGTYSRCFDYYQQISFWEILFSFRLFGRADIGYGAFESGYVLLNWCIGKLGFDFHSYLVIHSAICISSIGLFVYRYSKDPALSYTMFIALGGFGYLIGILRQSLALAVLLLAVPALTERNLKKYLLYVLFASLFHNTTLLALPLYFVAHINIKRIHYIGTILLAGIVILVTPILFQTVITPVLVYLQRDYYVYGSFVWNNMFLLMLLFMIFFAIFNVTYCEDDNACAWGFVFALLIQPLAFYVSSFSRAAIGIFLMFLYILFPNHCMEIMDKKAYGMIKSISFILMFVFYIYTLQSSTNVPYVSVFE